MAELTFRFPDRRAGETDVTADQIDWIQHLARESGLPGFDNRVLVTLGCRQAAALIGQLEQLRKGSLPRGASVRNGSNPMEWGIRGVLIAVSMCLLIGTAFLALR